MLEQSIFWGYLIILLVVGWYGSKFTKNVEDFYVAGRKLGSWVMAFTHEASVMSGWVFLGAAGFAYSRGYTGLWNIAGPVIGTAMVFALVAIPTWRIAKLDNSLTPTDVWCACYSDDNDSLRIWFSIVTLVGSWLYVLAQLVASGKTLSFFFGWNYSFCVILAGVVITAYTVTSGMFAVAWTDFIQGILMVVGLTLAAIGGAKGVGGFVPMLEGMRAVDPNLVTLIPTVAGLGFGISFLLGEGTISYLGQVNIFPRYIASRSEKSIANAAIISIVVISLFMVGATIGAFAGRVLWPEPSLIPGGDPEFVLLALFRYTFPSVIAAFFTTAVLAAAMSTADTWLLVASSSAAWDIYTKIFNKKDIEKSSSEKQLWISRIVTIIIGLSTIVVALKPSSVLWLVAFAWGTFACLAPAIIGGYWWKKGTKAGAIASIAVGIIINTIWYYTLRNICHPAVPAMLIGTIAYIVVSLNSKPRPKKNQELVDFAKTGKLPTNSEWNIVKN